MPFLLFSLIIHGIVKVAIKKFELTAFEIKLLAVFAMTLDHIGWIFFVQSDVISQILHFFGRLTAPLMCFFLVEGYYLSQSKQRYAKRLLLFAVLSQLPFTWLTHSAQAIVQQPDLIVEKANILFNLLFALGVLSIRHSRLHGLTQTVVILAALLVASYADWGVYIIVFCLVFDWLREDRQHQIIGYTMVAMAMLLLTDLGFVQVMPMLVTAWFPLGILLTGLVLYTYQGKKGRQWGGRYFFYAYYPLHIVILAVLADSLGIRQ
ncbi:hypothetical protein A9306_03350 [Moraxella atlantae]|uniref:Conjugal transfer protein TrbP n=1 Tax=Faucicola atlantae TaxID=34059 RepID=A0A1B8QL00_9GAMM|nr:hypothetical protein A9306_03350 [Moraxella atlantae]